MSKPKTPLGAALLDWSQSMDAVTVALEAQAPREVLLRAFKVYYADTEWVHRLLRDPNVDMSEIRPPMKQVVVQDGSVPPDPAAPRFDFGGVRNIGLYHDGRDVQLVEGGVNVGTARALDDACSACGAQLFETPHGLVCVNGHGGSEVIP